MPTPFSPSRNIPFSDTYNFFARFQNTYHLSPYLPLPRLLLLILTFFFSPVSYTSTFPCFFSYWPFPPSFLPLPLFYSYLLPPDFSLSAAVISSACPFPLTLVLHSLSLSFFLTFSFYTSTPVSSGFLTFSCFHFSCSLLFYDLNFLIFFLLFDFFTFSSIFPTPTPSCFLFTFTFHTFFLFHTLIFPYLDRKSVV